MTKSKEIKAALKKSFPSIKFSVTYKHPYGYKVKWENGIKEGATSEAVKAIADKWDEQRNISHDPDPIYIGDSVSYDHEISDQVWKQFVIEKVQEVACTGAVYNEKWDEFRDKDDRRTYHENDQYREWLYNGIKSDLENSDSVWNKEQYYKRLEEKTNLEKIECKDVVEALKTAKTVVSFRKADSHTQKLFIAANQGKFLAVGYSGRKYAIATCELETSQDLYAVIPLAKSEGKEIGFCPFMKVISKRKKTNDFTYRLDTTDNDEIRLVAECDGSKFKFNTLPIDTFNISDELQVIIDDFMGDSQSYEVVDTYNIEQSKIENNDIELVPLNQVKDIDTIDTQDNNQITENTQIEPMNNQTVENKQATEIKTKYVQGVGDIELISVDKLQVGMYLFFNEFFYTVSNIEKVDFINNDSSYIVTVNSLLSAVETQKILLSDNEQLTAWAVSFENTVKPSTDEPIESTVKQANFSDITPEIDNDSDLPKPVKAATHNRGIKGDGRNMLLKMLAKGATLEQIMASFNWSKKTASNMMTYTRGWGYNVKLENKVYRIV